MKRLYDFLLNQIGWRCKEIDVKPLLLLSKSQQPKEPSSSTPVTINLAFFYGDTATASQTTTFTAPRNTRITNNTSIETNTPKILPSEGEVTTIIVPQSKFLNLINSAISIHKSCRYDVD